MSVQGRRPRALFSPDKTFKNLQNVEALPPAKVKWTLNKKMLVYMVAVSMASSFMTIGLFTKEKKWMFISGAILLSLLCVITCHS